MSARTYVVPGNLVPKGFEQITSLSSAASLTPPAGARIAVIQAQTQNVRWRDDGADPTASIGMLLLTTDIYREFNGDLSALSFIEAVAGAVLNVSYYG